MLCQFPFLLAVKSMYGCADLHCTDTSEPGFQVEREREAWVLCTIRPSGQALILPGDAWGQGVSHN